MLTDANVSSGNEHVPAPVEAPQAPSEKLVPQSQVDRIAHERHKAGYEKGKSEAGSQGWDEEKLRSWYQEERKKEIESFKQQAAANQLAQIHKAIEEASAELLPKLKESGTAKYDDFGKALGSLDLSSPGLIHALRSVENAADVAYELAKDPVFEDTVMRKLKSDDQKEFDKGMKMLNQLSETIKNNESAKAKVTPSPLSTVKASSTGADNGVSSISDLRKKYRG